MAETGFATGTYLLATIRVSQHTQGWTAMV